MCGRYVIEPADSREIAEIIAKVSGVKTGEIYPTNKVPIMIEMGEEITPVSAVWGFPKFGNKSGSIINARSETALDKSMFRKSILERRCAFPTTGFYEWGAGQAGKKQKYEFHLAGQNEMYLAGIWNDFAGERRCVILTTHANESMSEIHERMPLVLKKQEVEEWVKNAEQSVEMLHELPPSLIYQSVKLVSG